MVMAITGFPKIHLRSRRCMPYLAILKASSFLVISDLPAFGARIPLGHPRRKLSRNFVRFSGAGGVHDEYDSVPLGLEEPLGRSISRARITGDQAGLRARAG